MLGKNYDYSVKTIVVGDSGVGKTCILFRFVRDTFQEDTPSTLGVEFVSKIIDTKKQRIELQLWDTAGQELFRAVTRSYYRGSVGAFIVYDITNRDSFINVRHWLTDVRSSDRSDIVCILIGNKSDLNNREVSTEEGQKLADDYNMTFFETSAKTGEGVEAAMISCLIQIEKLIDEGKLDKRPLPESYLTNEASEKKNGCC